MMRATMQPRGLPAWRGAVAVLALASAALAAPLARAAEATVDASGPFQLINTASRIMLDALDAHRAEYRKDSSKLYKLVDDVLLPHFDTEYAARLVLGKNWRTASPEQRKRFVDAFYKSLLQSYGDALVEFTADRMQVFPLAADPTADHATVRTEIKRSSGDRIPVNYSLRKTDDGWKAWDVTIEGISYVKSFREDFATEIEEKGLDAVIRRLEAGDFRAPGANSGPAKKGG